MPQSSTLLKLAKMSPILSLVMKHTGNNDDNKIKEKFTSIADAGLLGLIIVIVFLALYIAAFYYTMKISLANASDVQKQLVLMTILFLFLGPFGTLIYVYFAYKKK